MVVPMPEYHTSRELNIAALDEWIGVSFCHKVSLDIFSLIIIKIFIVRQNM
jgi:hypothetical protein